MCHDWQWRRLYDVVSLWDRQRCVSVRRLGSRGLAYCLETGGRPRSAIPPMWFHRVVSLLGIIAPYSVEIWGSCLWNWFTAPSLSGTSAYVFTSPDHFLPPGFSLDFHQTLFTNRNQSMESNRDQSCWRSAAVLKTSFNLCGFVCYNLGTNVSDATTEWDEIQADEVFQ